MAGDISVGRTGYSSRLRSITTVRRQHYSDRDGGEREHRTGTWRLYIECDFCSDTTDPKYQLVTVDNPYPGVLGGISTAAGAM